MPHSHSTAAGLDRDLALVLLIFAALTVLCALAAALDIAAIATTGLHTGIWAWPDPPRWPLLAAKIAAHPADPGRSLPPPWSGGVTDHQLAFHIWFTTIVMLAAGLTVGPAVTGWDRLRPGQPGHT